MRDICFLSCIIIFWMTGITCGEGGWGYDTPVAAVDRPVWLDKVVLVQESLWDDEAKTQLKPRIKALQAAGFNVLAMYPHSFCGIWEPQAGETWMEACHAEVKAAHAAGVRVLAGCYPFVGTVGARDLLENHPEWRLRRTDATPEGPGEGCLISPYGQAIIERLVSRMKEYDVDGFQFDGWYHEEFCRCEGCKKRYKQETGKEVPPRVNKKDPEFLQYLVWRDKALLERFVELQRAIRQVKPEGVLVNWNRPWPFGSYPSEMPYALNAQNDWTNKEWWDHFDSISTWEEKLLRGSSGDRPAGIQQYMYMRIFHDIRSGLFHGSSCPMEEVLYRMHEIMAMGSIPMVWSGARRGWTEADADTVNQSLLDFLPYVHQTRTLKYAACIDSYTSLQMCRSRDSENHRIPYARGGAARALAEAHIPFDVLSEHNLTAETLAAYRVVILPDVFCMSDRMTRLLSEYVMGGGGLIATYESSLYDEWGNRREDFALAELFGATFTGSMEQDVDGRVMLSSENHAVVDDVALRDLIGGDRVCTYAGRFAEVQRQSGTICPLTGEVPPQEEIETQIEWIPLVLSQRGDGRVGYFPAAIGGAYFNNGYPYQRMLFVNSVRWAAGELPGVLVDAPMCVQAGFFTKEDAATRQQIVHLLNEINSTTGHGSANEKQQAFREEVIPIYDLRVTFRGEKPASVFLIPEKTELPMTSTESGWEVTVPKLNVHGVVTAEWWKTGKNRSPLNTLK